MIMIQKFNSLTEIDSEFIPTLEELLAGYVPSFEYLLNHEQNAPDDIHFSYFLFFCDKTNVPIGFAQGSIHTKFQKKLSFFEKLTGTTPLLAKKGKHINWSLPTLVQEGFIFDPRYKESCENKVKSIITEFFEREEIELQSIFFSEALESLPKLLSSMPQKTETLDKRASFLLKNKSSYQEFVNTLGESTKELIQRSWKITQKELGYKLGDYAQYKEIFQYKSEGSSQYKGLKQNLKLKQILSSSENISFLTLENDEAVKAIIPFIQGTQTHCFYDVFILDPNIAEVIPHQIAIMKLYESPQMQRLHYLGNDYSRDHFRDLGFQFKSQYSLSINKKNT